MDVLEICNRLSSQNRQEIVDRFCKANPHWRGAQAADIIDMLDNADSNLNEVEAAYEAFPWLRQNGFGTAVRALYWAGIDVTDDSLRNILKPRD